MPWHASLELNYRRVGPRTTLQHRHQGPLRILKSLYPEGEGICHNVLVHPPGGLVGGDALDIRVQVDEGAHALISTPGATRFYRSEGAEAIQSVHLTVAEGARLEWLPLEAIAYPGCRARNALTMALAPGAECLGWDLCALGLPAAGQAFASGELHQDLRWPGVWLERAHIRADDSRLLNSPLGLAGQRALGTLWLARAEPWPGERREALLAALREALPQAPEALQLGLTCPDPRLIVLRGLAPQVEPLMAAFQAVWAVLRARAWGLGSSAPRIWRV
jgi:urease accessory protein